MMNWKGFERVDIAQSEYYPQELENHANPVRKGVLA
jgi:hypothetical protein